MINQSQNVKVRQSNMELLRLLSMLMIMVGHCLFFTYPNGIQIKESPILPFVLFQFKGLSICSVDVFVLISGWFGIRFKGIRLSSLIFQTLFFSILIYFSLLIWKPREYMTLDALSTIICFHSDDYWFIKAYVGLYLIAPFLNRFIEAATEKELKKFLIFFYIFQTIYGWLNLYGAHWFEGGFSMISFMGLYILARYLRLHVKEDRAKSFYLLNYVLIGFCLGLIAFLLATYDIKIYGRLLTYTCPLVILESVFLLLFFSKLNLQSIVINSLSASCLSMYLLHANELILRPYYFGQIKIWGETQTTLKAFFYSSLWVILFLISSIIIDFGRKKLWNRIELYLKSK